MVSDASGTGVNGEAKLMKILPVRIFISGPSRNLSS